MKTKDKSLPMGLLSIHIDEVGDIEDVSVVDCFGLKNINEWIHSDIYDIIECAKDQLKEFCTSYDTLYHVYFRLDSYECGNWEYQEWETEVNFLQVIPVIYNYEQHLKDQTHEEEQTELKDMDENVHDGDYSFINSETPTITYNDLKQLTGFLVEKDIRLAHRIHTAWNALKLLGDLFDENIYKIELLRQKFKNFIKHNSNLQIEYHNEGYYVINKNYLNMPHDKRIFISYAEIDNFDDQVLLQYENQALLSHLFDSKEILEQFDRSIKISL